MESGSRHTIAMVSGSYGAGHDVVARELTARLIAVGARVTSHDIANLLACRTGQVLRWTYQRQLRSCPGTWGRTLTTLDADSRASRTTSSLLAWSGSRLVREVSDADLVISTHPFASQILGAARAHGRLACPVVTYLTDASVHRLWVSRGVDRHLAIADVAAEQARALGASVEVIDPVVPSMSPVIPQGWCPPWPAGGRAALVVGGSLGVGQLRATAQDILSSGLMTPVVACGRNDGLRRRLGRIPGMVALGWRSDLPALMSAADCVIQNAGGMSSLEALAARTPTFTYRPIPGHGISNAIALDQAGLVPYLQGPAELNVVLSEVLAGDRGPQPRHRAQDWLDAIAGLLPATSPRPEIAA